MEAVRFFWMLSADDAVLLGLSSPDLHRVWSGLNEGYEGGVCILGWRRADGRGVQIFWGLFISVGNIGCCANLLWWRECWTSKLLMYWSIHSSPHLWSTGKHIACKRRAGAWLRALGRLSPLASRLTACPGWGPACKWDLTLQVSIRCKTHAGCPFGGTPATLVTLEPRGDHWPFRVAMWWYLSRWPRVIRNRSSIFPDSGWKRGKIMYKYRLFQLQGMYSVPVTGMSTL